MGLIADWTVGYRIAPCRRSALFGYPGPRVCDPSVNYAYSYVTHGSYFYRDERSICWGILFGLSVCYKSPDFMSAALDDVLSCCTDPSRVLAETTMLFLTQAPSEVSGADQFFSYIDTLLQKLSAKGCLAHFQRHMANSEALRKHPEWLPELVRYLIQSGMDANATDCYGQSFLHTSLQSDIFRLLRSHSEGHAIRKIFLGMLIEAGVDVTRICYWGDIAAQCAWDFGHWDAWCEALQENGISVQEVNSSRPQGWMIRRDDPQEE